MIYIHTPQLAAGWLIMSPSSYASGYSCHKTYGDETSPLLTIPLSSLMPGSRLPVGRQVSISQTLLWALASWATPLDSTCGWIPYTPGLYGPETFPLLGPAACPKTGLLVNVGRLSMTARTYATLRLLPQVAVIVGCTHPQPLARRVTPSGSALTPFCPTVCSRLLHPNV